MKKIKIVILVLLFILQVSCVAILDLGENPSIISTRSGAFAIDPTTLLQNIIAEKPGIYVPIDKAPDIRSIPMIPPVSWGEEEYVQIAKSVHQEIWQESLEDWNISDISFSGDCPDIEMGLQFAAFELFKYDDPEHDKRGKITYHLIMIRPRLKYIMWNESVHSMSSGNVNILKFSDFISSASEALRIAENKGGKLIREDLVDQCYINIHSREEEDYNTWEIQYFSRESTSGEPVFEYTVKRN